MFSLTIKSIKANKVRFLLTGVAVMLGVAFMAGTLVLTDTIKQSYDNVAGNIYKSTDAVVRSANSVKDQDGKEIRGTIDAATLTAVRKTPGVKAAEAQQAGVAVIVAHNGTLLDANRQRAIPIALAWQATPELNPMKMVNGSAPRAPSDVVIDQNSFRKGNYRVGEKVHVLSQVGSREYTLTGAVTYGGSKSGTGGAQVVAFAPQTAAQVLGTPGRYTAIQVVAQPGVSQAQLVKNLQASVHQANTEVISGAKANTETRDAAGASLQFINMFLMTFALVALLVGSFVIYNTFSITVAQRTKETALLRAIGAKRKQVMRSVMLEAFFTGVVASAIGLVAGIATAQGLRIVLSLFGMETPAAGTVVNGGTLIVALVTGIVVTLIAAYIPARKAGKVAPIEALRDVAIDHAGASKKRAVFGTITTLLGVAFIAQGLAGAGAGPVGLGALAVFVGVAVLGPVIARPFAHVIGAPLPRLRGMAGTLARENATRNPKRTSATASALMIGVALVAFITVFASSAKASISTSIDKVMASDWIVETQWGMGGMSPAVTQAIDALPETGAVSAVRFVQPKVGDSTVDVTAFDPKNIEENVKFDLRSGSLDRLGAHEVAVQADEAKAKGYHIGSTVSMFFPETGAQPMKVVAIYGTKQPLGKFAMSLQAFDANVTKHVDDVLMVTNAKGVSMAQARHAIDTALRPYPTAELRTRQEWKGEVANQIDKILNLVYVLLAMALVIALFGIANTLALSVFERTREFGLLRAVGMARSQVRSTVRWESVLIALLGTTTGVAIGLGFAWAMVKAASGQGINQMAVPVTELAVIVTLAAVAAVVAAALPARRAAKLDVLESISE
jgi:putative ABC transport system permease protein